MTDIRNKNGVLVKERMSRLHSTAPIDREPMTRDEYFTAVLMEVGIFPEHTDSCSVANAHLDKTVAAMMRLAKYGPPMALGYTDFLRWCSDQKENKS